MRPFIRAPMLSFAQVAELLALLGATLAHDRPRGRSWGYSTYNALGVRINYHATLREVAVWAAERLHQQLSSEAAS